MILTGTKLEEWFAAHSDLDGFWDFMFEAAVYDEHCSDYDGARHYPEDLIQNGYDLAQTSSKTGNPVYSYSDDSGNTFYFVGKEEEIIQELEDEWTAFLLKYPVDTPEQVEQKKIAELKAQAEKELKAAKKKLKTVKSLEKETKTKTKNK